MTITLDHLREVLNEVGKIYGIGRARDVIQEIGGAQFLVHVPQERYEELLHVSQIILRFALPDGLERAAHGLQQSYQALDNIMGELMAAKDNLREAVDAAANEMTKAADFIKNHPATADDPELQSWADRLNASAQALAGVDTEPAGSTEGEGQSA